MDEDIIHCTRAQCARLLGLGMDTLRYYESLGLVHVCRDASSHRCVYTEREIMRLLDFRKMKSLGLSNSTLIKTFGNSQGLSHLALFDDAAKRLQSEIDTLNAKRRYVRHLNDVFTDISARVDEVRIGELPQREYLLFAPENEALIRCAMEGLPYLNYGYWISRRCICDGAPWAISLAIDVRPLLEPYPALYRQIKASGCLLTNGAGMKVYRYQFFEKLSDLCREDFLPLEEYAHAHRFRIQGDVFGGILGPEIIAPNGKEGYLLTQTMEIV